MPARTTRSRDGGRARIAFVKFAGLAAGGTERWLQMMAANLDRERFDVDYFFCDAAPYVGSDYRHPDTAQDRVDYLRRAGVPLRQFRVGMKDIGVPTHDWLDTDFWEVFDPEAYDLVQTAKAGPAEYPYHLMRIPVVEYLTLNAGVDHSASIALSINLSQWQRRRWVAAGGDPSRSAVIPIPAEPPASAADLREELGIPADAVVVGFHQRAQDEIFSDIPLRAFARLERPDRWFLMLGGGEAYRRQASELGLRNVVFLPHTEAGATDHGAASRRISAFLNSLDVYAHGRADSETFGTVLAEAMMHGRPCLSHRSPVANAQPETMGPSGLFARDGDHYTVLLKSLLSDGDLRARLAAKARPHAERYYSLEACVRRLEGHYDRLLGSGLATGAGNRGSEPISYGISDVGCLVAGDIADPESVAHHVVVGGIPHEDVVSLLRLLLVSPFSYHELGRRETSLLLAAATVAADTDQCSMHPVDADVGALEATIGLNNWEDRVNIRPGSEDWQLGFRGVTVVAVTAPELIEPALRSAAESDRPDAVVIVRGKPPADRLRAMGYRWQLIGASTAGDPDAGWWLCFPSSEASTIADVTRRWRRDRRRSRRRASWDRARRRCRSIRRVAAGALRS